jgi:HlyD family secretion protein
MGKKGWVVIAAVIAIVLAGATYFERNKTTEPKFRTEKVNQGDVVATVTASGTLSAVTTVQVGSQVSGIIAKLHADFNSQVKKGQLLAELDPTPFQAAVDQQQANVQKARVDLTSTQIAYGRSKNLLAQGLIARSDFDTATAARDGAAAGVKVAQASLQQAVANLSYTKILSPIDGIVVDRQYNVGQTVAASFQAPTIFTIAQDLAKMQVLTNMDESDIGGIKVGQPAMFTVDAFPDQTFRGTVSQIRLSPQTVQNVVTYPVVIDVANTDLKLKPGMTADVQVPINTRHAVLRVPNAALRFKPDPADLVAGATTTSSTPPGGRGAAGAPPAQGTEPSAGATGESGSPAPAGAPGGAAPGAPGAAGPGGAGGGRGGAAGGHGGAGGGRAGRSGGGSSRLGTVYVEAAGGKLKPVAVRTSITDGAFTAVASNDLKAGDEVVIGLATLKSAASSTSRPPTMGGGGGGGRGPRM